MSLLKEFFLTVLADVWAVVRAPFWLVYAMLKRRRVEKLLSADQLKRLVERSDRINNPDKYRGQAKLEAKLPQDKERE